MAPRIGYLLPTRERIMLGEPATGPLLALAERAERLGYDSIWIGDSLLARPRHDPLTLLAAVAARLPRIEIGTAVLLPALRNPVVLAHQIATLDQISEGRFILGIGLATDQPPVRAEFAAAGVPFEKRVGRTLEGLRLARALWRGEPVDWDGRWKIERGVLAPVPYRPGGPPVWMAGSLQTSLERTARYCEGWMPIAPDAAEWATKWRELKELTKAAGRDPAALTGSMYLTVSIDDDIDRANDKLNEFQVSYYGQPAAAMRRRQACYAGPGEGLVPWLQAYADAGASHLIVRFVGDHERHLDLLSRLRSKLR